MDHFWLYTAELYLLEFQKRDWHFVKDTISSLAGRYKDMPKPRHSRCASYSIDLIFTPQAAYTPSLPQPVNSGE